MLVQSKTFFFISKESYKELKHPIQKKTKKKQIYYLIFLIN